MNAVRTKSTDRQEPPAGLAMSDQFALVAVGLSVIAVFSQVGQWQLNFAIAVVLGAIGVILLWQVMRKSFPWASKLLVGLVAILFACAAIAQVREGLNVRDSKALALEKQRIEDVIVESGRRRIALYKDPTNETLRANLERYYLTENEGGTVLPLILANAKLINDRRQKYDPTSSVVIRVDVDGIAISPDGTSATATAAEVWRQPLVDARTGDRVQQEGHPRAPESGASPYELEKTGTGWRIRHNPVS